MQQLHDKICTNKINALAFQAGAFLYINHKPPTKPPNQQKQADNYQRRANRNEEEQREIRDDLPKHKPKAQTKITSAERINQ